LIEHDIASDAQKCRQKFFEWKGYKKVVGRLVCFFSKTLDTPQKTFEGIRVDISVSKILQTVKERRGVVD